jgi:histidyl-tRNA synthetase
MAIQTPKGTRDFLPDDERIQQFIFAKWRMVCESFGYEPYEGPTFEHLELYTGKSGAEIVEQLYHFQDKGGRDLSLRPEMTPTLARMVAAQGGSLRKPVKWYSIPRLFRYERAQKGRLREFYQLNMDILGTDSLNAEVDLLLAINALLGSFGLDAKDFRIGVSSRRLLQAMLLQLGVQDPAPVYSALDKRAKIDEAAFRQMLGAAGLESERQEFLDRFMGCSSLEQLAPLCETDETQSALQELSWVLGRMAELGAGASVVLDLSVVRGLAYYTGIVFEVFDSAKEMRAIAGGGRYDDLCDKLGGQKVTGVGFGLGDVVLRNLLEQRGLLPQGKNQRLDYWIASFSEELLPVFRLAAELRARGHRVGHGLEARKFAKQMQEADANGAAAVILLGSQAAGPGEVELKDLRSGEQKVVRIEAL